MEQPSIVDVSETDHSQNKVAENTDAAAATSSLGAVETRVVGRLRITVVTILTAMALLTSFMAFGYARNAERKNFEENFESVAEKLARGFEIAAKRHLAMMEGFAMDVTAYAKNTKSEWPYVALPDFQLRAEHLAREANLMSVAYVVVVDEDEEDEFIGFLRNETSQQEGWAIQLGVPLAEVPPIPPFPYIVKFTPQGAMPNDIPAPFLVSTQVYPSRNSTWRGNNLMAEPSRTDLLKELVDNGTWAIMPSFDYIDSAKRSHPRFKVVTDNIRYSKFGNDNGILYENDAIAPVMFPVFDELDRHENRSVVGAILGGIYWRTYLSGLLPSGSNGVCVVLRNTCDQVYTYRVDGLEASFVGIGDLHETQYDEFAGPVGYFSQYDVVKGGELSCQYSVQAFASREFEKIFVTANPWYFSITLALVFVFTSAVFLLYDYAVEKRQRVVLRSALRSGAIVTSLFPDQVRERLYEEQQIPGENEMADDMEEGLEKPNNAIASSYPNCSVCFMDIAGFTKWSSSRTPADVFALLEAAYSAFDELADKRKVFKVETIGDCYVAVTGLPNEQPDHAVIMAKFATQCLGAFQELVSGDLANRLGEDISDLDIRIGIHSGEVVAGVLRGRKSRFQIFGDTVNVAARCESLGQPNRIHLSDATSNLLQAAGKAKWLSRRLDEVEAKGKGKMQTYWLNIRVSSNKSLTSLQSSRKL